MTCFLLQLKMVFINKSLCILINICLVLILFQLIVYPIFISIQFFKINLITTSNVSFINTFNKASVSKDLTGSTMNSSTSRNSYSTINYKFLNERKTTKFPNSRPECERNRQMIAESLLNYVHLIGDDELRQLVTPLFTTKKLVIWTSDHHSAPVLDFRSLLEPLGVEFIDHTLFPKPDCEHFCHCEAKNGLRVLNPKNVLELSPSIIADFQRSYPIGDPEISRADAFATFHCFGHFELFQPFNKSIIAISTIRYETCRTPRRWEELNSKLKQIHNNSGNVVGANNRYDQEYIRYFTGLNVDLIPSFCLYTNVIYKPTRSSYIFSAQRSGLTGEFANLWNTQFQNHYRMQRAGFALRKLRRLYLKYDYSDLASHLGIVHIPYQVSTMSIFEQFRMGIPLFFPSIDLFTQWNVKYRLAYDRTSAMLWGFSRKSDIAPHASQQLTPDPNNESDPQSQRHWLPLADYFTFPHITYFNSIEELIVTLNGMTIDRLLDISHRMQNFNRIQLKQVLQFWRRRLTTIAQHSANRPI